MGVPFLDHTHAEANLARVERRLMPELVVPLASLLSHSPDPDGALRLLERYLEGAPAQVLEDLARYPTALTYLIAIFGYSESLGETFLEEPSLAVQFALDRHFPKLKSIEDLMQDYARYSVTSPDLWLASQLARFKRRNFLRIALKDVLGFSTLGETTLELSTLADVILKHALAYCDQELEKRHGPPQYRDREGRIARSGFSIVSLGKLGGNELNYGSDVDLLFLYAREGETAGSSEPSSTIANKEYFVRLAEAVTRTITQPTPHGEVYRVDLRLRPEGEKGDAAISVNSGLEYYEHRARDSELQMLVKARHSAGDAPLTREFLRGVEPYVYREGDGARLDLSDDIESHSEGIRHIEALTQQLQRSHGRDEPWVRAAGTLLALRRLNDKGILTDSEYARLTAAYEFLRKVEHRLLLGADQVSKRLPQDRRALNRLALRVGIHESPAMSSGAALMAQLQKNFTSVAEICAHTLRPQASFSEKGKEAPN